jgi:hypothetical protein
MAKAVRAGLVPPPSRSASTNGGSDALLWERLLGAQLASSRISSVTDPVTGTTSIIKVRNRSDLSKVGFQELTHGLAKLGHSLWKLGQDGDDVVVERLADETIETEKWSKRKKKGELEDALSGLGYPREIQASLESTERRRIVASLEAFQPFAVGETILIRGLLATVTGRPDSERVAVQFEGSGIRDIQAAHRIMDPYLNDFIAGFCEQAQTKIAAGTWSPKATQEAIEKLGSQGPTFAQFVREELRTARKLASPSKEWTEWNGIWVRDYTDLLHGEIAMMPDTLHWELFAQGELIEQGHSSTVIDAKRECDQAAEMLFPIAASKKAKTTREKLQEADDLLTSSDPELRAEGERLLEEASREEEEELRLRQAQEYPHDRGDLTRLLGVTVINELSGTPREGEVVGIVGDAYGKQQWIEVQYDNGNYGRVNPNICGYDPNREALVIVASARTAQLTLWEFVEESSLAGTFKGGYYIADFGQGLSSVVRHKSNRWVWQLQQGGRIIKESDTTYATPEEAQEDAAKAAKSDDLWKEKAAKVLARLERQLGPDGFNMEDRGNQGSVAAEYRNWNNPWMETDPNEEDDDGAEFTQEGRMRVEQIVEAALVAEGLTGMEVDAYASEKWWFSVVVHMRRQGKKAWEEGDEDFSPPDFPDEFEFRVDVDYMGVGVHKSFYYENEEGLESFSEQSLKEDIWDFWLQNGGDPLIDESGPTNEQLKEFEAATRIDEVKGYLK